MASGTPSDSPGPRRSQREKKLAKPFASVSSKPSKGKRKRPESDAEVNPSEEEALQDAQDALGDGSDHVGDEEENYHAPKPRTTAKKRSSQSVSKPRGPQAKKPRVTKSQGPKTAKATRRGRKAKDGDDTYDVAQVVKETKIAADNPLFNAVMNPSSALQSTAEDFLESLEQSPGAALAELINLVLRACGCNDSVNSDEVLDYDGVVDALDNFTEGLKQDNSPVYPLTSKLPVFKKFRKSLSEFIERVIASSAELGALYTSDLMETLQTWVIAMSSSHIRSFRHTATVVALEVETALCDVAAVVEKEAEVVGRQREGEKKRKSSNKGGNARLKELEAKAQEIRERRTKVAEFLKEFVDGVFVHRYRDLDPNIRAECVHAIGLWFKKYPEHFLDAAYLRYIGWVLSDSNTHVRLEAVKSLSGVYNQSDYIGSFNHFTERFKSRLIEMATKDTELSIRVAVIQVLGAVDGHSLLEDEEREKLCLLLFDEEAKVRKTVSRFVKSVWEESVDERLVGKSKSSEEDRQRAGIKAIAMLFVGWGKILDKMGSYAEEDSSVAEEEGREEGGTSQPQKKSEVASLAGLDQKGRIALAVEALWDEVDGVRNWQALLDLLLLDHSATDEDESQVPSSRGPSNSKNRTPDSVVDEAWRLEEVEESVLLEVFVAVLHQAKAGKRGEDESVANDITRELIKGLPRLFIKHQTDQNRIAHVLLIPNLLNLDLYLEMRMIASYASLWDDVTKQFLSHSSPHVLAHAMSAIRYFMEATSLSNTNSTKIFELEDELSSILRDTVAGRDEIEVASFTEDEVLSLGALCTRLALLSGTRNMATWIEEDEGGKQSSAWDILNALVERGRLGYKEEATMVEQALHVLALHVIWKARCLRADPETNSDDIRLKDSLLDQREVLLEKLIEYAIGTQSNTVDRVRRAAFKHLLNLHVLFAATQTVNANGAPLPIASVSLSLDDEIQYRCAGYIQAEIERYAESIGVGSEEAESEQDESGDDSSDGGRAEAGDDTIQAKKRQAGKRKKSQSKTVDTTSRTHLEQEYTFIDVMSTFLRAIRAGAVDIRHGAILLTHYGRMGPTFDVCSKTIVDILREEGVMNDRGDVVVFVITQALQEAYTLVLDAVVYDETSALKLSKLLATCLVIRGSQLSIVRRLGSQYVVQIHAELISWIAKRLAVYESNKNKKSFKLGMSFFRVLVPLLATIQSRDALKIKAHMDQVLAQGKVEVSGTSKSWEPQRAYEKRLTSAMSKEKGSATVRKGKGKDIANTGVTTDEEPSDGEGLTDHESKEPSHTKRHSLRLRSDNAAMPQDQGDVEQSASESELEPATPKPRPRPKPTYKPKSPVSLPPARDDRDDDRHPSVARSPSAVAEFPAVNHEPVTNAIEVTPRPSRKRARSGEDEDIPSNGVEETDAPVEAPNVYSDDGEIQIRRKRVRH